MRSLVTVTASWWKTILFWGLAEVASAAVLHVPNEYSTIQSALDAVSDEDTVLVEIGFYPESLVAPPVSFTLLGNAEHDTGDYARPIIDPSSLLGSDTLACLLLPSGPAVTIEDFLFRNGPEMFPHTGGGGIVNYRSLLTVRYCLFDSVYRGIRYGSELHVENCQFSYSQNSCIQSVNGPLFVDNSLFEGNVFYLVDVRSHSTITNSEFSGDHPEHLIIAAYDNILIENCVFGPYGPNFTNAVEIYPRSNCVIRNCVFVDIQLGGACLNIAGDCAAEDPMPIAVTDNIFVDFNGGIGQGGRAISTACQTGETGYYGLIENNLFINGSAHLAGAVGISCDGSAEIQRNRFVNLGPPELPDVRAVHVNSGIDDTLTMRENLLFDTSGIATATEQHYIDARWNWWGDSSGPYVPGVNPDGRGGQITGNVDFEPWLPDTSFLSTPGSREALPDRYELKAYPNPFNASTQIIFATSTPGVYRLELFDILGRRVKSIWTGAVAYGYRWRIVANDLPSGIYFVRISNSIYNRPVAMTKIVLLR